MLYCKNETFTPDCTGAFQTLDREERVRERAGLKERERGVMAAPAPCTDHQKRASQILLTHSLPHQRRDTGLTHSVASQLTRYRKLLNAVWTNTRKIMTHPFFFPFTVMVVWAKRKVWRGEPQCLDKKQTKGWTSPCDIKTLPYYLLDS